MQTSLLPSDDIVCTSTALSATSKLYIRIELLASLPAPAVLNLHLFN
jgi:hypothetical protein